MIGNSDHFSRSYNLFILLIAIFYNFNNATFLFFQICPDFYYFAQIGLA